MFFSDFVSNGARKFWRIMSFLGPNLLLLFILLSNIAFSGAFNLSAARFFYG